MKKTVHKPWGKEEWLELNDKYCYKRIYINAGYKTSYQYHLHKRETNYIIEGKAEIWLENDDGVVEKTIMTAGDYFNVTPPKKHRVIALTDIILQEVSTPEVDDVIRIEDDTNRKDGRIESEHSGPAVLILAAGKGTRLKHLTDTKNKALLPINNKAIISHIIEKFPASHEIIVAVGYQAASLIDYCNLAHPDRKFTFVTAEGWEDSAVGPGQSALACKSVLQRPFYITTADCIVSGPIPVIPENWLGVSETVYPEKYSTINVDKNDNVIDFVNKSPTGYDNAFIGLAHVQNYEVFWKELEQSKSTELVSAWKSPKAYQTLKVQRFTWFDTGNFDDLADAKRYFNDRPMSLQKNLDEITYKVGTQFIKFNANRDITKNRYDRGLKLKNYAPRELVYKPNFMAYKWSRGNTLYEWNSLTIYNSFLQWYQTNILNDLHELPTEKAREIRKKFYLEKTNERIKQLPSNIQTLIGQRLHVNGHQYNDIANGLVDACNNLIYTERKFNTSFHGDLQFDNIIYCDKTDVFTYIDWRESMAGYTDGGDTAYDLAKLYGGILFPYNLLKNPHALSCETDNESYINYSYKIPEALIQFRSRYENWIEETGVIDLHLLRKMTALIYINMSPLHDDVTQRILIAKASELSSYAV